MSKISTVYYLGKGEVRSSILRCSTMKTPYDKGFAAHTTRRNSEERGKNARVAIGENPWNDVRGSFRAVTP